MGLVTQWPHKYLIHRKTLALHLFGGPTCFTSARGSGKALARAGRVVTVQVNYKGLLMIPDFSFMGENVFLFGIKMTTEAELCRGFVVVTIACTLCNSAGWGRGWGGGGVRDQTVIPTHKLEEFSFILRTVRLSTEPLKLNQEFPHNSKNICKNRKN